MHFWDILCSSEKGIVYTGKFVLYLSCPITKTYINGQSERIENSHSFLDWKNIFNFSEVLRGWNIRNLSKNRALIVLGFLVSCKVSETLIKKIKNNKYQFHE